MRVLVTGGTGFVGRKLVCNLLARGHEVYALCRKSSKENLPDNVIPFFGDVLEINVSAFADYFKRENIDAIVHLAAVMDIFTNDQDNMFKVNVEGTTKLAQAAAEAEIKKFIYISSTEAMGGVCSLAQPMDEDSACKPNNSYGATKVSAEAAIKEVDKQTPLNWLILRPTGLFGRGDDYAMFELIQLINMGLFFFVPGKGDAKLMFTHVDDTVSAILSALETPASRNTLIICPDEYLTYKDWIEEIASGLQRIKPFVHLPLPLVKIVVGSLAPLMNIRRSRTFMFAVPTIDRMREDRWYSNKKAKNLLKWAPARSLRQRIQQTINDHIEERRLSRWKYSPVALLLVGVVTLLVVLRML